jgi:hypothetical protein
VADVAEGKRKPRRTSSDPSWLDVHYDAAKNAVQIEYPSRSRKPTWLGEMVNAPIPLARRVTVLFAKNSDDVLGVSLEDANPLQPADLSRASWADTLKAARAERTRALERDRPMTNDAIRRLLGDVVPPKHPGRRGHDADHYRQYGEWADELRAQGVANPARAIAEAVGEPDREETIRGWLKEATRRGFAKPGKPGRPRKRTGDLE